MDLDLQSKISQIVNRVTRKHYIYAAVALVIFLAIIFSLTKGGNGDHEIYVVKRRDIIESTSVSGIVEAGTVADLGFEVSGRVKSVSVKEGDVVPSGSLLVSLDLGTLTAELEQARADVLIKEAELTNANNNLKKVINQQDTLVESAYRELLSSDLDAVASSESITATPPIISGRYTGTEGIYKIIINSQIGNTSRFQVRTFGIESSDPVKVYENKSEPLGTYGLFISFPDVLNSYGDTIWFVEIPNTDGSSYTKNLNAYEEALRARDIAIEQAQAKAIDQGSGISIAEAELLRAKADVSKIQAEISKRLLVAPFSGIVTQVNSDPGEIVSANTVVVSLISDDGFGIEVDLPEVDSVKVKIGDLASVTLDAFGDVIVFEAVVTSTNQAETIVDGVSVYETRLVFTEEDSRVRSGMTADVDITTQVRENVLAVPVRAVKYREDGSTYVIKSLKDGNIETNVVVGLRGSDSFIEILSGLSEGDNVVISQ